MIGSCIFRKRRRIQPTSIPPSIHSLIRMRLHLSPPPLSTRARPCSFLFERGVVAWCLLFPSHRCYCPDMRDTKIHRHSTSRYSAQTSLPLLTSNSLQADVPCHADTNMPSVMMSPQRPRENGWDCFTVLYLAPFPERMEWKRRRSIYGILVLGLRLLRLRRPRRHRSWERGTSYISSTKMENGWINGM